MKTTITTKYKTNANGTGQILAKGGGKQRTVFTSPERNSDRNHGEAAAELAMVLGLEWHDGITHEVLEDGRHKFKW